MDSSRVATIRAGYEYFEKGDTDRLGRLFHDDAIVTDPIHNTLLKGRKAVERLWHRSLAAVHSLVLGDMVESGETVVVSVHHDFYADRGRLGPGVSEIHRFVFRDDRIARLEITTLDEFPDEVRSLLA